MGLLNKLASPFKGKAARDEEKLGIANFKRQEVGNFSLLRSSQRVAHSFQLKSKATISPISLSFMPTFTKSVLPLVLLYS
jgi:hypothetical protein